MRWRHPWGLAMYPSPRGRMVHGSAASFRLVAEDISLGRPLFDVLPPSSAFADFGRAGRVIPSESGPLRSAADEVRTLYTKYRAIARLFDILYPHNSSKLAVILVLQHANRAINSAIGSLSCVSVSRSRMVTVSGSPCAASSPIVPKSTVMHLGVPISSCLR